MGSIQWPLLRLDVYGSLSADGQSFDKAARNDNGTLIGGLGGGSGGTILLFLQELRLLAQNSSLSVVGGKGGPRGGGGGGGGRVHFHWSKIDFRDEYTPFASISGFINRRYALVSPLYEIAHQYSFAAATYHIFEYIISVLNDSCVVNTISMVFVAYIPTSKLFLDSVSLPRPTVVMILYAIWHGWSSCLSSHPRID